MNNTIQAFTEDDICEQAGSAIAGNCLADILNADSAPERLQILTRSLKTLSCIKNTDRALEGFAVGLVDVIEMGLQCMADGGDE